MQELQKLQNWVKPTTDKGWAEDVKAESFDVKFDDQLVQMKESLTEKLPKAQEQLDKFANNPDDIKSKLTEEFSRRPEMGFDKNKNAKCEGRTLKQWVDDEFQEKYEYHQWKVGKIKQSLERITKEQELRLAKIVEREPIGTVYYIDPVNGAAAHTGTKLTGTIDSTADNTHVTDDAWAGADDYINGSYFYNSTVGAGSIISDFDALTDTATLATAINGMAANDVYYILDSWLDLDNFTEAARSAGDRCVVRRTAAANCDNGSDLTFTSSGTFVAPIVIESDYDNEYHDKVDLSATATATLTFGSKTVTYSAAINGVLAAGDWIYANGDNVREFAYEVASIGGANLVATLYLPYKGAQAGAGVTTYNIQDNPIWNTAAGNFQWVVSGDSYWKVQGIHIRGTDSAGNVQVGISYFWSFKDIIFTGDDATVYSLYIGESGQSAFCYSVILLKCRTIGTVTACITNNTGGQGHLFIKDCLLTEDIVNMPYGHSWTIIAEETTLVGIYTRYDSKIYTRNVIFSGATSFSFTNTTDSGSAYAEDYDGTVGDTRQMFPRFGDNTDDFQIASETGTVRAGGATTSIKITPNTYLGTSSEFGKIKVFELPIYATTDSKTYTVYFNLPDANFTVDPTAAELWIELEAWGHAANNYRKITKSTGTITGDGTWRALTVTVAPAQAGIAYLRCYYCKTKEAASNIFYVDPRPEIA